MHLVTCKIMLGGDTGNIVVRGEHNPVSWPEVGVLQFLHGEESVYDVVAIKNVDRKGAVEKDRLCSLYNAGIVEQLYPGRTPVMEMSIPGTTVPGDDDEEDAPKAKHGKPGKRHAPSTTIPPLNAEDEED